MQAQCVVECYSDGRCDIHVASLFEGERKGNRGKQKRERERGRERKRCVLPLVRWWRERKREGEKGFSLVNGL